ncbi:unnamed protein product [Phytophthora lilii]|uniref:Unnamed protein product n=1 Tax=Phytophthora lilii TaxID=2077276 RepID=A0A9W6X9B5_9STRA|nr:unnamed protein product [Phytophthora lilii]
MNRTKSHSFFLLTEQVLEVSSVLSSPVCHVVNLIAILLLHFAERKNTSLSLCTLKEPSSRNLLIQHGADLYQPDNQGVTPLQLIIRAHDTTMLQIILNHHHLVPTEKGEDFAGSVFMAAVDEEALPVMKFLLEEGYVGLDYQNVHGETAMHRALLKQKPRVTKLLCSLDNGARVLGLLTTSNESCLHYAARYSSPGELQHLLDFYGSQETVRQLKGLQLFGAATLQFTVWQQYAADAIGSSRSVWKTARSSSGLGAAQRTSDSSAVVSCNSMAEQV